MNRPMFLSMLAAAAAASGRPLPAGAQPTRKLNVGAMGADFSGQAFYAKDLGMFAKAGFNDSTVTTLNNGASIVAATLSGTLDVGYSNVLTLAVAHDKGIPIVLLAGANLYDTHSPTVGLLGVKRTSAIKTASDLTGKTIAVGALNSIPFVAARNWIDANGGDSTKVKFVEMPISSMPAAIMADRIDCGSLNQGDYPTLGKPDDQIRVICDSYASIGPRFISGAWFSTADWVAKNPADAKSFVAVMHDVAVWANAHTKDSAAILGKYLKESVAAIEAAPRVSFATSLNAQSLQPSIDVAAKYGVIKSAFPARDFIASVAI